MQTREHADMKSIKHIPNGFTLLEMLITVSIVVILVTAVAPNIQSILITNRVTADLNNLSAAVQRARFTAVDEQATVIMCPTENYSECTDDWSKAKMVFIDENDDDGKNDDEPIIITRQPINDKNTLSGISGNLEFDQFGSINKAATILICATGEASSYASALLLSQHGRIAVAIDANGSDGIKEDLSGAALDCS